MNSPSTSPRTNLGREQLDPFQLINGNMNGLSSDSGLNETQLEISQMIQIIKNQLEHTNDINTARRCLEILAKVGSGSVREFDHLQQFQLLETMVVAIDVLRNNHQDVGAAARGSILEYLNLLDINTFSEADTPDVHFSFLIKCVRSGVSFCLEETELSDTFCALIFDIGSILLSQSKYDVFFYCPSFC